MRLDRFRAARAGAVLVASVMLTAAGSACGSADAPVSPRSINGTTADAIVNGSVRLAYSLDLPPGSGPFPAVVLGHGSGQVTRQQLLWLSQQFVARGVAVLRFDKRGVGESTGVYSGVGVGNSVAQFSDLASDIVAAVRFVRGRAEIDARRVGLAGVSQAGWILPIAARELGDAAFMILWSGPVCSVGLEIFYSDLAEFSSVPLADVYARLPSFSGAPGFDPIDTLRVVSTPTLWLLGLDDRSIPVKTTLDNLAALTAGGRPFEWRTYPGLGHSLSPGVWDDIGPWLARMARP